MLTGTALITGAGLGLAGGVAPGPLTALVLTRTLRYGPAEGIRIAMAPILTDGPLLLGSAFLAQRLSDTVLGIIAIGGAAFLVWLGIESFRAQPLDLDSLDPPSGGVLRAILTNLLNPHPYLFWIAIGGPLVADAAQTGPITVATFLIGFFGGLCGAKAAMALLVGSARGWLTGRAYVLLLRVMGVLMWTFAIGFLWDAAKRLAGAG